MKNLIYLLFLFPLLLLSQKKEIAFKTFTVNTNSCNGFQSSSGSLIYVPDNAFVKEDGSPCLQTVIIKYREFHSQTDMFYGGINMLLEENNKYRILESAGMFEIEAWCGTDKLILKEGKQIQVRMKCRRNIDGLMSFIYDRKKNTWSKYPGQVYDFSYFEKNNNSDSLDLWGSKKVRRPAQQAMNGDGEIYEAIDYSTKLPEGFFKGMNVSKLGLFNYDGVIKDELAIPMIPEFFVKQDGSKLNQQVYIVYQTRNTMVYYSPEDFAERFVLLNAKGIRIFSMFTDGSVAVLNAGEIDKLTLGNFRNKNIKFTLDKQPVKPKTEKELSETTGLSTN